MDGAVIIALAFTNGWLAFIGCQLWAIRRRLERAGLHHESPHCAAHAIPRERL
jgi:hypothetical protein